MEGRDHLSWSTRAKITLGIAIILFILAAICCSLYLLEATPTPWAMLVAAVLLFVAALWFGLASLYSDTHIASALAFPDTVTLAAAKSKELRRDFNRAVSAAEDMRDVVISQLASVKLVSAELAQLSDRLTTAAEARLTVEIAERTEAESALVQWQDRVLDVVRGIERLLSTEGIDEAYAEGARKVLGSLERQLGPVGLLVIRPEPGDRFDEALHEVVGVEDGDDLEPGSITRALSWGLVAGSQRERARVFVTQAPQDGDEIGPVSVTEEVEGV